MPLCFDREVPTGVEPLVTTVDGKSCPTGAGPGAGPAGSDILVVAALGALGGALAATLSIRNLKGTSTPYDVPVALALLKVPLGALTAILALVAIQGDFVPGLSILDSQGQILAYALVFGFAQQAVSRLLDQRAQSLLEGLPGGAATEPAPPGAARLQRPVPTMAQSAAEATATEVAVLEPAPEVPVATIDAAAPVPPAPGKPSGTLAEPSGAVSDGSPVPGDRPVDEPDDATQQDQLALLRETGNERRELDEADEAKLLQDEFGPPDARGIYGARDDATVP